MVVKAAPPCREFRFSDINLLRQNRERKREAHTRNNEVLGHAKAGILLLLLLLLLCDGGGNIGGRAKINVKSPADHEGFFFFPIRSERKKRPGLTVFYAQFMQRAAASSPNSRVETAAIKLATTQENARRDAAALAQRLRNTVTISSSSGDSGSSGSGSDNKDVETQWELSYVRDTRQAEPGLKVVADVGYSELHNDPKEGTDGNDAKGAGEGEDAGGGEDEDEGGEGGRDGERGGNAGRLVFGNFRKKAVDVPPGATDSSDDSDSDGDSGSEKRKEQPRRGADSLRGLKSISNGGMPVSANIKCANCGKMGHKAAECSRTACYACGGFGHLSNDCPNHRRRNKRKEAEGRWDSHPKRPRPSM